MGVGVVLLDETLQVVVMQRCLRVFLERSQAWNDSLAELAHVRAEPGQLTKVLVFDDFIDLLLVKALVLGNLLGNLLHPHFVNQKVNG